MIILNEVGEIFAQYELKPIELPDGFKNVYDYLRANPLETEKFESKINDGFLLKKYREYVPKGWHGFDIGTPIIPEWMEIIDKIVELCIENDPDFEIHQIKLKFGGIRFYVESELIEDIHDVELLIEDKLFDPALIY
jgi:hypothetical protein